MPGKQSRSIDANQINYSRVLHVLRDRGHASRVELTRRTGLSPATVTSITRDLIQKGYVKVGETKPVNGRGRPTETLIYDAESRYAIGLELHDHSVYGVLTDLYARPLHTHLVAPVADSSEAVIDAICEWVEAIQPAMGDKECVAFGVAVPGGVDQKSGRVVFSTEFELVNVPIVPLLEDRLQYRVTAINRAYAAALAEAWLGAAREAKNVMYVRLGEYIGGAILIDGLPYLGSTTKGVASIAHIPVDPNGLHCRCGSRGCLDTVASGSAMARQARSAIKTGRHSSLEERTNGYLDLITGKMVAEEARNGDALAQDVMQAAAHWLGIASGIVMNLLGPDMIVFGGELGRVAGTEFTQRISEEAKAFTYTLPDNDHQTRIIPGSLGEEAVACGAAAAALWANLTHSISLHMS